MLLRHLSQPPHHLYPLLAAATTEGPAFCCRTQQGRWEQRTNFDGLPAGCLSRGCDIPSRCGCAGVPAW